LRLRQKHEKGSEQLRQIEAEACTAENQAENSTGHNRHKTETFDERSSQRRKISSGGN
jgi:hypothetical protein